MSKLPPKNKTNKTQEKRRAFGLRSLLLLLALGLFIPFAWKGWADIYESFLERTPPEIEFLEVPRGIGLAPVSLRFRVRDTHAGLDEVKVTMQQRQGEQELLKERRSGFDWQEFQIDFSDTNSKFREGTLLLSIKAFDRSLWSNGSTETITLLVDYRKPNIEVLSTQHNIREDGSQLLFYRATEENPGVSGVKVGNRLFPGFPARNLDAAFRDPSIFVSLFSVPSSPGKNKNLSLRAFIEDQVGNTASSSFYYRILPRKSRIMTLPLDEASLRRIIHPLAERYFPQVQAMEKALGKEFQYETPDGSRERLFEEFAFVNKQARNLSQSSLLAHLNATRYDRYWDGPFLLPSGVVVASFGNIANYSFAGESLGKSRIEGYFFVPSGSTEVRAANRGIVLFSEDLGIYGTSVGIDHGLGLVSVYSSLAASYLKAGEEVDAGELLGEFGQTAISRNESLHFYLFLNGVPVDAREWWDRSWYYAHVEQKIEAVKKQLGIPLN